MEIIYFYAPICPKCVRTNRWMNELKETHPAIEVKKYNLITNKEKRIEYQVKTIPTLIIGEVKLGGLIKKEEYDAALEKFLKNKK